MGTTLKEAHKQWRDRPENERFHSLADLHAAVRARCDRAAEYTTTLGNLRLEVIDGDIQVVTPLNELVPTNWGFGQLCRLTRSPADYLSGLPAELAVQNLRHGLSEHADQGALVYATSGEDSRLLSLMGPGYKRFHDERVVQWVRDATEGSTWELPLANPRGVTTGRPATLEEGGVPSGAYASDRDVFIFMVDPGRPIEYKDEVLYRGFIMANSDVGRCAFSLMAFLFRTVCGNHIIHGAEEIRCFRRAHRGDLAAEQSREQLLAVLDEYRNQDTQQITQEIRRAMEFNVGRTEEEVVKWLRARGVAKGIAVEACSLAEQEEGGYGTLWQVVQGLTSMARGIGFLDQRTALEKQAGDLLRLVS